MQSALQSIRFRYSFSWWIHLTSAKITLYLYSSTEFDSGICNDFLADIVLGVNEPRLEKKSIEDDEHQENPVQKSLKVILFVSQGKTKG
jgi:hypothetical protein